VSDGPRIPRPPRYPEHNERLRSAFRDTLPPEAKRAHSERDIKVNEDLAAMARAVTTSQVATNARFDQLVSQVAALHAHQIHMHAWLTRHPWLRNPITRLVVAALGAAAGAYVATKGAVP
jgi:hypothetical protein